MIYFLEQLQITSPFGDSNNHVLSKKCISSIPLFTNTPITIPIFHLFFHNHIDQWCPVSVSFRRYSRYLFNNTKFMCIVSILELPYGGWLEQVWPPFQSYRAWLECVRLLVKSKGLGLHYYYDYYYYQPILFFSLT